MSEVKCFKLVPASMLLDKETIGVINFHCGDGADGQFGEYSDGHLWVGTVTDDDGKEVYGLHLSTAEYPEEGSSTLIEFEQPEDAAQAELAALREELAQAHATIELKQRDLIEAQTAVSDWARRAGLRLADCQEMMKALNEIEGCKDADAALLATDTLTEIFRRAKIKPTGSGASE